MYTIFLKIWFSSNFPGCFFIYIQWETSPIVQEYARDRVFNTKTKLKYLKNKRKTTKNSFFTIYLKYWMAIGLIITFGKNVQMIGNFVFIYYIHLKINSQKPNGLNHSDGESGIVPKYKELNITKWKAKNTIKLRGN